MIANRLDTLIDSARDLANTITQHEQSAREIASKLLVLEVDYGRVKSGDPTSRILLDSFTKFMVSLGVPQGSIYYYRNIGRAIQADVHTESAPVSAGIDGDTRLVTNAELAAAGRALGANATPEEVKTAIRSGTIKDLAEARANETRAVTVLRITIDGKREADAARDRIKRVYASLMHGEALTEADALEWAMRAFNSTSETDLTDWFRNQIGGRK